MIRRSNARAATHDTHPYSGIACTFVVMRFQQAVLVENEEEPIYFGALELIQYRVRDTLHRKKARFHRRIPTRVALFLSASLSKSSHVATPCCHTGTRQLAGVLHLPLPPVLGICPTPGPHHVVFGSALG